MVYLLMVLCNKVFWWFNKVVYFPLQNFYICLVIFFVCLPKTFHWSLGIPFVSDLSGGRVLHLVSELKVTRLDKSFENIFQKGFKESIFKNESLFWKTFPEKPYVVSFGPLSKISSFDRIGECSRDWWIGYGYENLCRRFNFLIWLWS